MFTCGALAIFRSFSTEVIDTVRLILDHPAYKPIFNFLDAFLHKRMRRFTLVTCGRVVYPTCVFLVQVVGSSDQQGLLGC